MKSFFLILCFYFSSLNAQECGVIYVTPSGASSGIAGTKSNPANLSYGLNLITSTDNRVWLATGTYPISNALDIPSNVMIDGGFDPVTWNKSNNPASIIQRDASNILPSAKALIGLSGASVSNFTLQDVTIMVADAPAPQVSIYGIYLSGCSQYNIVRCKVITGNAGDGTDGQPGANGNDGANGANGLSGNGNESPEPGGNGGTGGSGSNNGGNGARGGKWKASNNVPGSPGLPSGCGGNGAATASGGDCSCGNPFDGCPGNCGGAGSNGGAGQNGSIGSSGAAGLAGAVVAGFFQTGSAGVNGTNGTDGCGGGGGGGGGGRQQCGTDDVGGSGGGGGGGGAGGNGGTGGTGGGGSFAIFLVNNGANGKIEDCALLPGAGGIGGQGGAGGMGGVGGIGGNGGAGGACSGAVGGKGGNGGSGGNGGAGGNGVNGPSIALSENGGTAVSSINNNIVPGNPPIIIVENPGCTNAEIVFSSTTSGNWDFGAGANPSTASGAGPVSVIYSSTGRKTIGFSGILFTEFIDIFRSQASSTNTISNVNSPVVSGCPDTFSTTLVGSLYEWDFGVAAMPSIVTGPAFQSTPVIFSAPGSYTVELWVTTQCCGKVRDTLNVTVQPNTLNVSLTPSEDTICAGDSIIYTATPSGYQSYDFYKNNTLLQSSSSSIFTANNLLQGDSIFVTAFDGTCLSNPSAVHYPVINPIPAVMLLTSVSNDTICDADSVTLTATPSGFANYEFFDNGISVQSSAVEKYVSNTLVQGNSFTVIATDRGCSSPVSNIVSIYVKPTPAVMISVTDTAICMGDSMTVNATPAGLTNYDFTVNGVLVQNGALSTYTAQFNNGDKILVNATLNGCILDPTDSIGMVVTPIPSVALTSSAGNEICDGESVTFIAAPPGYDLYQFSDGFGVLQSSTSNIYSTSPSTSIDIKVTAIENNCVSPGSNTISTTVNPEALADFTADPLETDNLETVFSFMNSSSDADTYVWNFGDQEISTEVSPTHIYMDTGQYTITLIANNQFNCNDTLSRPAYLLVTERPEILVPNVFTPNGDVLNDFFVVTGNAISKYDLRIFNRWGELVFQSRNITNSWDGSYGGRKLDTDVFVYFLSVEFKDGKTKRKKGSITLLR